MEIIKFIQSFSNPFLDQLFQYITMMGEQYFYIVTVAVILWCVNKRLGYKLGFAILTSFITNGVIKNIFNSPRPIGTSGIRSLRVSTATGSSFPSGHTQVATAFWSSTIIALKKTWISVIGSIIILLVAISRLYLGVHWPKDVVFGIIFGLLSVLLSNFVFDYIEKSKNKSLFLIIFVPALLGLFIFKSSDYAKSVGIAFGFYLGYLVESHYIDFNIKASFIKQIFKVILGLFILIALLKGLKSLFPAGNFYSTLRYFITGFFATCTIPFIFKKLKL